MFILKSSSWPLASAEHHVVISTWKCTLNIHPPPPQKCLLLQGLEWPDTSAETWPLKRSSHEKLIIIGDYCANTCGHLKCACSAGKSDFPSADWQKDWLMWASAAAFLTWASKDVVLYYTSTKYETFQMVLLLGLTVCLKVDLAVVWIEDERM